MRFNIFGSSNVAPTPAVPRAPRTPRSHQTRRFNMSKRRVSIRSDRQPSPPPPPCWSEAHPPRPSKPRAGRVRTMKRYGQSSSNLNRMQTPSIQTPSREFESSKPRAGRAGDSDRIFGREIAGRPHLFACAGAPPRSPRARGAVRRTASLSLRYYTDISCILMGCILGCDACCISVRYAADAQYLA